MTAGWAGGALIVVMTLLPACHAAAQQIDATVYGVAATNAEVDDTRQARGLGVGVDIGVEAGRFRGEVRGETASLQADYSVQPDYALRAVSFLAIYRLRPALALELGASRRFASPDLVAQEVGLVKIGLRTQTRLSSFGSIEASAAYLPITKFSGGGESDLSVELGLGVSLGPENGRFGGIMEYSYQRIDREVNGESTPIQFSGTRVGILVRL